MGAIIERISSSVIQRNLPIIYPAGYLVDFYYDFTKPAIEKGITINLALDLYKDRGKIEYRFETTASYVFKNEIPSEDKIYGVFHQCLLNEITAYRMALNQLSLKGYSTIEDLTPMPPFEQVLTVFKELYNPDGLFAEN